MKNLAEDQKSEDSLDNFKENIIEDIPQTSQSELTRPIGKVRKIGKGEHTRLANRQVMQNKQTQKRRAKNKTAKKARRRNRRK
jgi:hypothetical protein